MIYNQYKSSGDSVSFKNYELLTDIHEHNLNALNGRTFSILKNLKAHSLNLILQTAGIPVKLKGGRFKAEIWPSLSNDIQPEMLITAPDALIVLEAMYPVLVFDRGHPEQRLPGIYRTIKEAQRYAGQRRRTCYYIVVGPSIVDSWEDTFHPVYLGRLKELKGRTASITWQQLYDTMSKPGFATESVSRNFTKDLLEFLDKNGIAAGAAPETDRKKGSDFLYIFGPEAEELHRVIVECNYYRDRYTENRGLSLDNLPAEVRIKLYKALYEYTSRMIEKKSLRPMRNSLEINKIDNNLLLNVPESDWSQWNELILHWLRSDYIRVEGPATQSAASPSCGDKQVFYDILVKLHLFEGNITEREQPLLCYNSRTRRIYFPLHSICELW